MNEITVAPITSASGKKELANELLGSVATHCLLYGGARAGKSFLIMRAMLIRAAAYNSRHIALRYRFNHIKASLIYDTLPKVMELCFPGMAQHCHLDKSDWFYKLPNGSEIWFGGLDDKDRTEKILGQEYATLFFNECSQIPWNSRNIAITRLAQNTPLRLKAYYDCNPPADSHWIYQVFKNKLDPTTRVPLKNADNYAVFGPLNADDNREHLPKGLFAELEALPDRMRRRFLLGEFGNNDEGALWTYALLDRNRVTEGTTPDYQRIIIAVDPSGCSGEEDKRSDEVGIVVVGLGADGRGYLLEDLSGRFGPSEWGKIVVQAFDRHDADAVVAEVNFGGAMVASVIRAAEGESNRRIPVREVHASRGKIVRAEPVSALYEAGKISHVGYFEKIEEQLCSMTTAGYMGDRSPDRADALVWAWTELFPAMTKKDRTGHMPPVNVGYDRQKRAYAR